jgi:hypothetical protein
MDDGLLQEAFVARLKNASAFTALGALKHGWPRQLIDTPTKDATPLTTWFVATVHRLSAVPGRIEIQTDTWEWPAEAAGRGLARLRAIDQVMQGLLGEMDGGAVSWEHTPAAGGDPVTVTCACIDGGDPPEKGLLRRRRVWEVAFG